MYWMVRATAANKQVCNKTQQTEVLRLIGISDLGAARVIVAEALFRFMKAQPSVDEAEAQTWVWTLAEMERLLSAANRVAAPPRR